MWISDARRDELRIERARTFAVGTEIAGGALFGLGAVAGVGAGFLWASTEIFDWSRVGAIGLMIAGSVALIVGTLLLATGLSREAAVVRALRAPAS